MTAPIMPKATAVWLIDNTTLSFVQIANFCNLHLVEIEAIADGEVAGNIVGLNPILNGQLTKEEIEKCEKDDNAELKMIIQKDVPQPQARSKGAKYVPMSKRQDKPDAISWLLKHHEELSTGQICKLVGTTKNTIDAIKDRTHRNSQTIKPRNPVTLGICKEADLEKAVIIAANKKEKAEKKKK